MKGVVAMNKFIFFSLALFGLFVHATGLDVNVQTFSPTFLDDTSGPPVANDNQIEIDLKIRCAGANLRDIPNPLARWAVLIPVIKIHTVGASPRVITYSTYSPPTTADYNANSTKVIPTWISHSVDASNIVNNSNLRICKDSDCTTANGASGSALRTVGSPFGIIKLKLPTEEGDLPDFWSSTTGFVQMPVVTIHYIQNLLVPDTYTQYMGYSGLITGYSSSQTWDPNGRKLTINAVFFGEQGYCGGFHSPLVLFFDNNRPEYKNIAQFDSARTGESYFWPEQTSNTYFLALDRNKNGSIDKANELFGNLGGGSSNGFTALKVFDLNADGVIDKKDAVFSKLLLWKDSTGKGNCLKKDLFSLKKMGVESISLKYKTELTPFNGRAEERQTASFQFSKKGKTMSGRVVDVWLSLANTK
jgi:hypothetical protein